MSETPSIPPPLARPKISALAVLSLVLGIFGILLVCVGGPLLFAIPAIICGHVAVGKINRAGGMLTGKPVAIAGFVTGYVSLGLMLLLLPIAIPNFIRARNTAQANACINNLRLIDGAKQQWAQEKQKEQTDTPSREDLKPYVTRESRDFPECPAGGTYTIKTVQDAPACSVTGHVLP